MPEQLSLRFPDGTFERAERLAERMSTTPEFQGLAINKTRLLIQGALLHLDYLEDKYGPVKKRRRQ